MKEHYFLSQPHQPFFLLGVVNAVVMMLLFALSYKGVIVLSLEMLPFHVYSLVFLLFSNVFTGFLFTTFPRFNQTQVIQKSYYTNVFYTSLLGTLLFVVGNIFHSAIVLSGMVITFVAHIFIVKKLQEIYTEAQTIDTTDSFWILTANYFGLLGHLLFLVSLFYPALLTASINISFYLYIIFLAFSVAQRMVPFFSHSFAQKNANFTKYVFVLFVVKTLSASFALVYLEILTDLVLAGYIAKEFLHWELKPFDSPAILWVLHLALAWLPLAFLLSALSLSAELLLETSFYFLNIHLLAIGFLTTLLIGFGTRVTLGHSGQAPHADKFTTNIFLFIQLVVLGRMLFSINIAFGWGLHFLFDISFTLWLLLFLVWGWRYARVLFSGAKI